MRCDAAGPHFMGGPDVDVQVDFVPLLNRVNGSATTESVEGVPKLGSIASSTAAQTVPPVAHDAHPTRGGGRLVTRTSGLRTTGAVAPSPPRSPSARAIRNAASAREAREATSGRCSSRRTARTSARTDASTTIRRTASGLVLLAAFNPSGFEAWNANATTSKSDSPPSIARLGALVWIASSRTFKPAPYTQPRAPPSQTLIDLPARPHQARWRQKPTPPTVSVPALPIRPPSQLPAHGMIPANRATQAS